MVKTTKSVQYFSDINDKQLCPVKGLEEDGEEILGAVIEFNANYGGICDGIQSQYVIPEWLAKEFLERILAIRQEEFNPDKEEKEIRLGDDEDDKWIIFEPK